MLLPIVFALSACSSQGQPQPIIGNNGNGADTIPQNAMRDLITVDSIPISSLSPFLQEALRLQYANDPSVINVRVIPNPFPRFDSLSLVWEFRCNMSDARVFQAKRTNIYFSYTLNRPDFIWEGALFNTGVIADRPDFNYMTLAAEPDNKVLGGYQFFAGKVRVSNREAYEFDLLIDTSFDHFVLIHYDPSKLPIAASN